MKTFTTILSLLAVTGLSFAQEQYSIDPNSVDQATKDSWCNDQKTQCPLICLQLPGVTSSDTKQNSCSTSTLTYQCVCSNGVSPNVTQYSQTLPFHICQEWGNQCVKKCGTDNTCSNNCRANHPCGAQAPVKANSSIPTTMAATASTTGGSRAPVTGLGGSAATTGAGGKGAGVTVQPLAMGHNFGLAVIFAGVFAGFAFIL